MTTEESATVDQRDKHENWFLQELVNRQEPGGHLIVVGTRFHTDDLYGRLTGRTFVDDESEDEGPTQLWEHIVFPALQDPETGRPSVSKDAVPLWGDRWTRRSLMHTRGLMTNRSGPWLFQATYQQDPQGSDDRMFNEEWFRGEEDDRPFQAEGYPWMQLGSLDLDRNLGQPGWPREQSVRWVSMDPSPTQYAAAIIGDTPRDRGVDLFFTSLLDIDRRKMGKQDMFDLLQRWQSPEFYGPIDYLIFEKNNFARWFINDEEIADWCKQHYIKVIPHETNRNKGDSNMGFSTIAADIMHGRVRFPYLGQAAKEVTEGFIEEALHYSGHRKDKTDRLMALWFAKHNFKKMVRRLTVTHEEQTGTGWWTPPHLQGVRW